MDTKHTKRIQQFLLDTKNIWIEDETIWIIKTLVKKHENEKQKVTNDLLSNFTNFVNNNNIETPGRTNTTNANSK